MKFFFGFDIKKSLLRFVQAFIYSLYKLHINKSLLLPTPPIAKGIIVFTLHQFRWNSGVQQTNYTTHVFRIFKTDGIARLYDNYKIYIKCVWPLRKLCTVTSVLYTHTHTHIYIYIYIYIGSAKKFTHTLTKENSMLYNRLL